MADSNNTNVIAQRRIKELKILYRWCYGPELPDDDAGRDCLQIMADHYAHFTDGHERFIRFAEVSAEKWFDAEDFLQIYEAARAAPRSWSAQALGKELNLTYEDRTELGLRTIAPADVSTQEFAVLRRERRAAAERDRRRRIRERKAKFRPAQPGPFDARQQSLIDVLEPSVWISTKGLLDAVGGLPCWRDPTGNPLGRASLRRVANREMDELVKRQVAEEGPKETTKYGTQTRNFRLRSKIANRSAAHVLSRDTGTSEGENAA